MFFQKCALRNTYKIVTNFYFFHPNHVHLIPSDANDPQGLVAVKHITNKQIN